MRRKRAEGNKRIATTSCKNPGQISWANWKHTDLRPGIPAETYREKGDGGRTTTEERRHKVNDMQLWHISEERGRERGGEEW